MRELGLVCELQKLTRTGTQPLTLPACLPAAVGTHNARCHKLIDNDLSFRFNDLLPIGGEVKVEEKALAAVIFSICKVLRQAADNPACPSAS